VQTGHPGRDRGELNAAPLHDGSVQHATGTRGLDRLGGLLRHRRGGSGLSETLAGFLCVSANDCRHPARH
jgi:hypothetical protein